MVKREGRVCCHVIWEREGGPIKLLESRENDCAVPAAHGPYLTV